MLPRIVMLHGIQGFQTTLGITGKAQSHTFPESLLFVILSAFNFCNCL